MFLTYFVLWIIFNGRFTLEIGLFGLAIAGALLAFSCKFVDYSLAKELRVYKNIFLFLKYCCLLVTEIVKANLNAIRMILTQKEEVEPALVSFHTQLKSQAGKAMLANAITLEGSEYTVHCLDESMAEGIQDSEFVKYILKFEETI